MKIWIKGNNRAHGISTSPRLLNILAACSNTSSNILQAVRHQRRSCCLYFYVWVCVCERVCFKGSFFLTLSFILTGSEKPSRKPGGPQPSGEPEDPQQGRNSPTCQHEHMNSLWPSWHTLLPVSLILVSRVKEGGIYEIYGVFVGWQQANNTFWLFTWLSLEVFPSQLFLLLLRENEHKWLNFELASCLRCWTSVTAYLCLRLHLLCAWTTSLKIITPASSL